MKLMQKLLQQDILTEGNFLKIYAVIDTNVLVSAALNHKSIPAMVIEKIFNNKIIPILHPDIVNEYHEVLKRPKFKFDNTVVDTLIDSIISKAIFIDPEHINESLPDPKDAIFYEVVMSAKDNAFSESYLVTGNLKHFPIKTFIVNPRDFLYILEKQLQ